MELKKIPTTFYPAYTWLWNTSITAEGIKKRIDEMYDCGIRAFYIIGEPKNFLPNRRKTFLSPEYLSEEYIELLHYAFSYAEEKGMHTWLYNEGGFPSGMVCGKIKNEHPELAKKAIKVLSVSLKKGEPYHPTLQALAAFAGDKRIRESESFKEETTITEYLLQDDDYMDVQSDNASLRNTELFLEYTHEKLKHRFGDSMGTQITLMFDDEAYMGEWTEGLEHLFYDRYGYDILDFLPYISNEIEPNTLEQYRAKSDYCMLCGDLVRNNYFIPMRNWLRENGMYSTGHLDRDHRSDNCVSNRYGNVLHTLRAFDVPGVDAIWGQIGYPNDPVDDKGMPFFPRMASSAARQLGHSKCISESLAVYGAYVTPDLMRYAVNYQAVRGISLFNFMVMSYGKESALPLQYRPNFIPENPSMDRLKEINEYTARLSRLLQESRAVIDTALYYPARSICAGGKIGKEAADSFEELGSYLEEKGISFDIIDEELVKSATLANGTLTSEFVTYRNVILPKCALEQKEILEKLNGLQGNLTPCIERRHSCILSRKVSFHNGNEGYFICNMGEEAVTDTIFIATERHICKIDLFSGELYDIEHIRNGTNIGISLSLLRGESIFLLLTKEKPNAKKPPITEPICTLKDWSSYISRVYEIDDSLGMKNVYYSDGAKKPGLYEWDKSFSGEVTYTCQLPHLDNGEYVLSLGAVRHTASVYINGSKIGESTMPPYRIPFNHCGGGELTVVIANTAANACCNTEYFEKADIKDVGPYHAKMTLKEQKEPGGGLLGPVTIEKILS